MAKKTGKRKQYDWETIDRDIVAGQLSIAEIARQNDCSRALIYKRIHKKGLKRDLSAKVRAAVKAKMTGGVTGDGDSVTPVDEDAAIEQAAARSIDALRRHQKAIGDTFKMADRLIEASKGEVDANTLCNLFRSVTQGLDKAIARERQALNLDDDSKTQDNNDLVVNITFPETGDGE